MNETPTYISNSFKMRSGRFLSEMIFRYGSWWLIGLSLTAVIGIVFGITVDLKWLIVSMMTIFIILPMVAMFIYYYFGLKREFYVNTVNHRVVVDNYGITMRLEFQSAKEASSTISTNNAVEHLTTAPQDEDLTICRDERFEYEMLKPYKIGSDSIIIPFADGRPGFLWIPVSAFDNSDEMSRMLEFIDSKISG